MRNHFKTLCVCVCAGLGFWSNAQNLTSVDVVQEINYGNIHLYILEDVQTNLNYKSSASTTDLLDVGNEVQLNLNVTVQDKPLYIDGSISSMIAREISGVSSNSGFTMSNDIMYNLPYQDGDILFFENTQHIIDLTELLYNQEDVDISNDPNLEDSSIVFAFENEFPNFTSFREEIENRFHDQETEGYTEDDLINYYNFDHINDDALKSFFNKKRMIGIGDTVYYYHNTNEVIMFHYSHNSGYQVCSNLASMNKDEIGIEDIRGTLLIDPDIEVQYDRTTPPKPKGEFTIDSPNHPAVIVHRSTIGSNYPPADCENTTARIFLKVETTEEEYVDYFQSPGDTIPEKSYTIPLWSRTVNLEIKWKGPLSSGTELENIPNYDGTSISHNFNIPGDYKVITKMQYDDSLTQQPVTLYDTIMVEVSGLTCTTDEDFEFHQATTNDRKLVGKVWVSNNFFGKHGGSYSHAYKKKNNKWKRRRMDMSTRIQGDFHSPQCSFIDTEIGFKRRTSRRVRKTKLKGFFGAYINYSFGNNDVRSHHTLYGHNLSFQLILPVCH